MSAAMEQPQQQNRPRSKSTFSFKSDNSRHSAGHERSSSYGENKPHLHAATKADPNAAMNESQPSMKRRKCGTCDGPLC